MPLENMTKNLKVKALGVIDEIIYRDSKELNF